MISVQLKFNPYIPLLEILFDGVPISPYSTLRNYCNSDFETWSKDIFNTLYAELNDSFGIEYTGQYVEYEILNLYASNYSCCDRITYIQPSIPETPLQRLRLLNNMVMNGIITFPRKNKVNINLISIEEQYQQVKFPMLAYCIFKKSNTPPENGMSCASNAINIFICQSLTECETAMRQYHKNIHYIICDNKSSKLLINDCIVFCCCKTAINDAVTDIMNIAYYPRILHEIISMNGNDTIHNETYNNLLRLDAEIKVILPKELEVGVETKVDIYGLQNIERVQIRRTGVDFVSYSNGKLCAHNTGIARVELFDVNTNSVVATEDIKCIRKKHITRMLFKPSNMVMTVGEHRSFTLLTEPSVNDDMNKVRYISDNSFIAYELNNEIYAKEEGICTISATCGTVSTQCIIDVHPCIDDIIISPIEIEMKVGEVKKISINQIPEASLPGKYTVSVYPDDIVCCDVNSCLVQANKEGSATISISVGKISKKIRVRVYPKADTKVKPSSSEATDYNIESSFWGKLFKRR